MKEIKEGINIEILKRLELKYFEYENYSNNLIPFVAKYMRGEIQLKKRKDIKWLPIGKLTQLDFPSANIPFVNDF